MLPGYTADASLGRATRHYRTVATGVIPPADGIIVPSYRPTEAKRAECYTCQTDCNATLAICEATAAVTLAGCVFPPACPAASVAAAAELAACDTGYLTCQALCLSGKCCQKRCGSGNPLDGGDGCCDPDEQCVAIGDPNAREGCCPRDQIVCGGDCCAKGDRCCGGECCPPNWHCINNVCQQYPPFGQYSPAPVTAIPPASSSGRCPSGHFPCHGKCCEHGMTCCGYGCEWGHCLN